MDKKRICAYFVATLELPKITDAMNYSSDGFSCRVIRILVLEGYQSMIIVEKKGSYPFIENPWEAFFE